MALRPFDMLLGRDDQHAFVGGARVYEARPKGGLAEAPVEGVGEPVTRATAEHGGDVVAQDAAEEDEAQCEDEEEDAVINYDPGKGDQSGFVFDVNKASF